MPFSAVEEVVLLIKGYQLFIFFGILCCIGLQELMQSKTEMKENKYGGSSRKVK